MRKYRETFHLQKIVYNFAEIQFFIVKFMRGVKSFIRQGLALAIVLYGACAGVAAQDGSASRLVYQVIADGIAEPLAPAGDAARGRALLIARDPANCILCHGLSDPAVRFSGNLAPPLDGAGRRLTIAQLRLRVADSSRINLETIMPAYYKTAGLRAVAAAYQGRPVLTAQQVEDMVVYLSTLR